MPMSYDSLVKTATMEYVARIRAGTTVHAEPEQYADELLVETVAAITAYNAVHPGPKIKIPARLENPQVAELVVALEPAARIACAGPNADANYDLIGVYQNDGPNAGLYSVDEREIRRLVKKYKFAASSRDVQDIIGQLQTMLPRKNRTQDRNLIAVNNGVFDYGTKQLLPFSPDYYELSEPESCKKAMAEYKEYNDPLQMFMQDILPLTSWSLLPYTFLYDLYKAWFAENSPSGKAIGRNTFVQDIYNMTTMGRFPGWGCTPRKKPARVKDLMDAPEPLILRYQLDAWKNPNYTGHDPSRITPTTSSPYSSTATGCS